MIKIAGEEVNVTKFPDGTSQVWKLTDTQLEYIKSFGNLTVLWDFESEDEVFQVLQLSYLVNSLKGSEPYNIDLYCPFLPYGRQDKDVNNNETFALATFIELMTSVFDDIKTIDAHSKVSEKYVLGEFEDVSPEPFIKYAMQFSGCDTICFPDQGAYDRYGKLNCLNGFKKVVIKKVRDQLTGNINGLDYEINPGIDESSKVLIVDDICDGGRTFIETSKKLHEKSVSWVDLYVSHGIFSKGIEVLYESGIRDIYTKEGKVER